MRIVDIKVKPLNLKLTSPFVTAAGPLNEVKNVYVEIHTNNSLIGIGESAFEPRVTGETQESIMSAINNYIKPSIIGEDPRDIERVEEKISKAIYGNESAKAGVDIALFDILGKYYNVPLYKLLGGYKNSVETDITISLNEPEKMVNDAKEAVKKGFKILKIKVGVDPSKDFQRVKMIRENIENDIKIRLDANQGWNIKETLSLMKKLEKYDIELLEQPVLNWNIEGLKYLRNYLSLPIVADESVFSVHDALNIIRLDAADMINIKLMKCGGIYNAIKINKIAEAAGIECMIGCMVESKISVTAAAHFAAAFKNITKADLDSPLFFESDFIPDGIAYDLGMIHMSSTPGLGISETI
ncbi:MAG: mandelate racemase/muconate lactonizing enzyme family protein [Defluviitoga tunisiensis]